MNAAASAAFFSWRESVEDSAFILANVFRAREYSRRDPRTSMTNCQSQFAYILIRDLRDA